VPVNAAPSNVFGYSPPAQVLVRVATFDSTVASPADFQISWTYTPLEQRYFRLTCSFVRTELFAQMDVTASLTMDTRVAAGGAANRFAPVTAQSLCGTSAQSLAQWIQIVPEKDGDLLITAIDGDFDAVFSLHPLFADCNGDPPAALACDDDSGQNFLPSVRFQVHQRQMYLLRVSGNRNTSGSVTFSYGMKPHTVRGQAVFYTSGWSLCSPACEQTRLVYCIGPDDRPATGCDASKAPVFKRSCDSDLCSNQWNVQSWGQCEASCIQKRAVTCLGSSNTFSNRCPREAQPVAARPCLFGQCSRGADLLIDGSAVVVIDILLDARSLTDLQVPRAVVSSFVLDVLCPFVKVLVPLFDGPCDKSIYVRNAFSDGRVQLVFNQSYAREAATEILHQIFLLTRQPPEGAELFVRALVSVSVSGIPSAESVAGDQSSTSLSSAKRNRGIAIGVGLGLGFLLIFIVIGVGVYKHRQRSGSAGHSAVPASSSTSFNDIRVDSPPAGSPTAALAGGQAGAASASTMELPRIQ